ncbi:MAG: DUF5337 domain-containing protein [Sulfitobacter sp.]|mgnify:CR=1|jgi:uncharacterized protein DUF5337|uniref:DUF5337 domain-containing protein n=1 Tax=Sulfitobacter sp. TaxID=1903071 RepID=UPI000C587CEC|nr:hypothetical protein [Roseobacter sp.]THF74769.1 MAG: hypothetical protein E8G75_09120 [Sulfitobacter sp. SK025]|tara:strand:- start:212 stop:439 length:228 start_codon:yes stop_codon:yes gene_type:complete
MTQQQDIALARKGRLVAVVIAVTILLWIAAQWIAPQFGLPGRYALLFDFAALAALVWAMVNIYQMRRARAASRDT